MLPGDSLGDPAADDCMFVQSLDLLFFYAFLMLYYCVAVPIYVLRFNTFGHFFNQIFVFEFGNLCKYENKLNSCVRLQLQIGKAYFYNVTATSHFHPSACLYNYLCLQNGNLRQISPKKKTS